MQEPLTPAATALDLPDNQRLALEALVAGQKRTEAAEAAGVTRKTVHRWLLDPVFLTALHQARCEAWTEVTGELHAHGLHAVRTLAAVLDCDQPRARVLAARAVLELSGKAIELENLIGRCALVEAELEARLNPAPYAGPNNGTPPASGSTSFNNPPPTPPARRAYETAGSFAGDRRFQRSPGVPSRARSHANPCLAGLANSATRQARESAKNVTSWDMRRRSPLAAPFLLARLLASRTPALRPQRSAA
jgi:hypothetical protein